MPRLSSEFFITKAFVRGSCWDQVLELHLPGDLMVDHLPNPLQGNRFFGKGQYHCFKCDIRDVRSIIMNYNPGCVLHCPLSLLRPHHLLLPGHHVARGVEGVGPFFYLFFNLFLKRLAHMFLFFIFFILSFFKKVGPHVHPQDGQALAAHRLARCRKSGQA